MSDVIQEGYFRHVGLSEVRAQTLNRAQSVHPITDLQIEYSLMSCSIEAEMRSMSSLARGDLERIEAAVAAVPRSAVAGWRDGPSQMEPLDSEPTTR